MLNIDFNNIRSIKGAANEGFEEFVCQLARKEEIPCEKKFERCGKPDGGVECYKVLEDGSIVAWQAKYFCKAFDDSQYKQINRSVNEALKSYPQLRRYIIVVPIDPSNAHVAGKKSMKERIDEYVKRWSNTNPHVIFDFWWASDLVERLQKPSNQGMLRFWFGEYEFTDRDFFRFNEESINDLGKRYTPRLNVEVEAFQYFEVLSRGSSLRYFFDKELMIAEDTCRKIEKNKYCQNILNLVENVRNAIKQINETNITGIDRISLNELLSALMLLGETVQDIANNIVEKERVTEEENRTSSNIFELGIDILRVHNDLHQDIMRLVNDPILILEGDAGVGKSHLMADTVQRRQNENLFSLLFLGQKFITDEEPFIQMMRMLNFSGSSDELLEMLETKAETTGNRIIIFIDAINEGHGLNIWQNNIRSFINRIRQHPWLGLVLSIRTSYSPVILPREEFGNDYCVRARHYGFGANTQKAVQLFFKEYGILYPSVPLLNPEFRNPLFLHLFCEGMKNNGYRKIPDGIKGISSVLNLFFDGIEKSLRKFKQYSQSIKCIDKAVREYIKYIVKEGRHEMPIETAVEIFSEIYPRVFLDGELLDCLLSEGVFSKNVFQNTALEYEECIYFTYERFENILQAEYLIDELQFDDKSLEEYIRSIKSPYMVGGLLEALAILLPERQGIELYDLLPKLRNNKAVVNAVLSSLIWRNENTIDSNLDAYFHEFMEDNQFRYRFIRTIMEISFNTGNYYNADYLHKMLLPMQLPDRDAMWIPILYRIYNSQDNIIEETINWVWDESNEVNIDEKSVELGATLLSWFLASTNRQLRDTATKSLVQLLHNRMQVLIPLLEKFSKVDDPYIHERLYGVALGCALRSKSKEHLTSLCQYIYLSIFNVKGEVYPHILLRDYAREIIEYAVSIGEKLSLNVNKIRPPYNSSFDYKPVSDEEIKLILDKCGGYKNSPGMCNMLTSMFTEHSTIGSYGDFGRYTFQRALSNWKIDAEHLSNIAIKLIIDKYGYREDKHGTFDQKIGSGRGRSTVPNERIGKKYQWLALHELLARVADNFKKLEHSWSDNVVDYEGTWEPFYREYYWSPAYKYYDIEGLTKRDICDKEMKQFIAHVDITTIGYLWKAEEDYSKKTSFYILMPSKQLFDGLNMRYADKEGIFLNEEGEMICFDAGAIERSKNYLLVRKDTILDYLKTHHKKLMWYVLGEKNIIGLHNYLRTPNFPMWLVVSGVYTLDEEGKVTGRIKVSHER